MEGWNFLKDPRNPFKEDDERWLFRRVLAEEKLKKKFIYEEWIPRAMEAFRGKIKACSTTCGPYGDSRRDCSFWSI
jgi:hypothetical protein